MTTQKSILRAGENCWMLARAERVAVLDESAAYYEAVADAFERAHRSILIVGWDLHSRLELRRRGSDGADSRGLLELLGDCARKRPELKVRILIWREDIIFTFEREMMQRLRFWKKAPDNLEFHYDDSAPVGSSQHQKIVVVDDSISFVGGVDLAQRRWDTAEHRVDDPRRKTPNDLRFDPYHDVHSACDAAAARAFGELARWRWEHATGEKLEPVSPGHDCWPAGLEPDFSDVDVGISRTLPTWLVEPEVREVQELFFDSFDSADELIYIENQYLSSSKLTEALARRLEEPDGPEVVLVVPEESHGLIEEATLDRLRVQLVARLRGADEHDRLRIVYPQVCDDSECKDVFVHAKVCVIDDRLLRVGSANLSNRSLGVDSECDLVVEAADRGTRQAIDRVRRRLLGHHLGLGAEQVAAEYDRHGSVVELIDAHGGGSKRLVPLEVDASASRPEQWGDEQLVDPASPLDAKNLSDRLMPESAGSSQSSYAGIVALLAVLVTVAALLQFTSLGEWADPRLLAQLIEPVTEAWWSVPVVLGGFTLLSVLAFPTSVLILAMGFIFGALWGSLLALLGSLLSASLSYAAGGMLGHDTVSKIAGKRAGVVENWVAKRGVWSVVVVRMIPVAPYGVVNLVIGSSRIPLRDMVWGTLIGMTPGIVLKGFFGNELADFLLDPDLTALVSLVIIVVLFVAAGVGVRQFVRKKRDDEVEPDQSREHGQRDPDRKGPDQDLTEPIEQSEAPS